MKFCKATVLLVFLDGCEISELAFSSVMGPVSPTNSVGEAAMLQEGPESKHVMLSLQSKL
jgi:hypothetical protein